MGIFGRLRRPPAASSASCPAVSPARPRPSPPTRASCRWPSLSFDAREHAGDFADFWPAARPPQASESKRTVSMGSVMPSCAQILRRRLRQHGREQRRGDAQRFGGGVERVVQQLARFVIGCLASFHGARSTMNLSTAEISAHTASSPFENSKRSKDCCTDADGFARRGGDGHSAARGNHALAVLVDHRQGAAGQVAEPVGEIGIVARRSARRS